MSNNMNDTKTNEDIAQEATLAISEDANDRGFYGRLASIMTMRYGFTDGDAEEMVNEMEDSMRSFIETKLNERPPVIDRSKIVVVMGSSRDEDSTNFIVQHDGEEVAYGHLNNKTNWAHVTIWLTIHDDQDLEDYIVQGIEERTIKIV